MIKRMARPDSLNDGFSFASTAVGAETRILNYDDYGVAIICPLEVEMSAVRYMLDEEHPRLPNREGDSNRYICGRMSGHNVVIGYLPQGSQGIGAAAVVATDMKRTFPQASMRLLVGIGGGVPSQNNDVRLGDVVVSMPTGVHGGVVQYDLGKDTTTGFERKGFLEAPPTALRNSVVEMQSDHRVKGNQITAFIDDMISRYPDLADYARPSAAKQDVLFLSESPHVAGQPTCHLCDYEQQVARKVRVKTDPKIFYGLIASGNRVEKNGQLRDQIAQDAGGALCFEMEAAGLMNDFRCIVIRGIADYADSHKNDDWHSYAAAVAAGCVKELLTYMDPVLDTHKFGRNQHWTITQATNPHFTGRNNTVAELASTILESLQDDQRMQQCRIVITGIGGQGKSEICLHVANRVRPRLWGVFWVDVSTTTSAESGFRAIAVRLAISASQSPVEVCQYLANTKQPWLLILDNADDTDVEYQQYFPSGSAGVIVLTSRNPQCHQYATKPGISLDGLPDSDAVELLKQLSQKQIVPTYPKIQLQAHSSSQSPDKSHLEHFKSVAVSLLHGHPLAITQAGAYISQGHCSIADYPYVFERQRQRLLTFRLSQTQSRYRDVYATFEASANALQSSPDQAAGDALQLLAVLSMLAAGSLPLSIFEAAWKGTPEVSQSSPRTSAATDGFGRLDQRIKNKIRSKLGLKSGTKTRKSLNDEEAIEIQDSFKEDDNDIEDLVPWHVAQLPPLLGAEKTVWDSFRLITALHLLEAYSLVFVTNSEGGTSVSMHPLAHAWAKDRQMPAEQQQSWLRASCVVAYSFQKRSFWQKHRALRPHPPALLLVQNETILKSGPQIMIIRLVFQIGKLLEYLRLDKELNALCRQIFAWLHLDSEVVSRKWLPLYRLFGRGLRNHGRGRESTKLFKQIAKIQEQTLDDNHPQLLASQHELARAYQDNGQANEAVALLERVVKVRERTLFEDDPALLASQHVLARAYRGDGQMKKATALLEQVVKISEQTLTDDNPDLLDSQHELAIIYKNSGQVQKAMSLLEQIVRIEKRTLAADHPDRLASQHTLASTYQANGQVKEAVALLEQVVEIEERTMAEDHHDRLTSQHTLARAYHENKQTTEAVALLKRVVKIEQETLAKDHPDRLTSEQTLASFLWELGDWDVAYAMMQDVVKRTKPRFEEGRPKRPAAQEWLDYMEDEFAQRSWVRKDSRLLDVKIPLGRSRSGRSV